MLKLITVLLMAYGLATVYMSGKYWVYDRCSESEWSDTVKLLYILIDTIKDGAVIFLILSYLLQ